MMHGQKNIKIWI